MVYWSLVKRHKNWLTSSCSWQETRHDALPWVDQREIAPKQNSAPL
jgi:hypothetical protein